MNTDHKFFVVGHREKNFTAMLVGDARNLLLLRLVRVSPAYPTLTHPPMLKEKEQPEICCWWKAEW